MSKTGRWRSEKNKIKALFVLQFHATGVAEVVGDSLLISLIPADVGKPTVRSDKAVIREGGCYWEKPIHESLRLFKEPRTGKFQEKIYYFVVSNGWSKADFVGEVSIDFASYAESFKVSSVSLPLKNAKCDALLHVSIQRVQEDVDQRETEIECAASPLNDNSLRTRLDNSDADETVKGEYTCVPRSPLYSEITITPERKRNKRESCGSDLTISSSESSCGVEIPTKFEFKDNIDPTSVLPTTIDFLPQSTSDLGTNESGAATSSSPNDLAAAAGVVPKQEHVSSQACLDTSQSGDASSTTLDDVATADRMVTKYELVPSSLPTTRGMHSNNICLDTSRSGATSATPDDVPPPDWLVPKASSFPKIVHQVYPTPEASTDDSSDSPRGFISIERSEESSRVVIDELRAEISTLSRKSEVAELELRTLRKMIVKETRKGQELLREVGSLKDEKNALRVEYEKFIAKNKVEKGDPRALVEELRQEVYYEKENNANLRVQLMKMQESNSELILAIRELDEMLEQKDNEILNLSNSSKYETDLYNELEMRRKDKDELEGHIEQLVLDYEILKQENSDLSYQLEQSQVQEQLKLQYECSSSNATIDNLQAQVEKLENKLKKQSSKFSESLAIIGELEEHANGLVEDLEKQAQAFEDDIVILTRDKIDLEKRAITAEEALRKTRWQNANTAERIHEEFRRISVEMTSTLESNETFTKNAIFKANELHLQKSILEDLVNKSKEEIQSLTIQYEEKLSKLSSQLSSMSNHIEQLQNEKEQGEESNATLSEEILMLKAEMETLEKENNSLYAEEEEVQRLKGELEQVNVSMREMEMVLESGKAEIVHLQEEAQQLVDELNSLRKSKDEKKIMIEDLQSELERLQNQHDELKHLLSEDELEKDNLKKTIMLLEGQIKTNEAALETSTYSYLEKEKELQNIINELERRLEDNQISATCVQKVDEDNDAVCLDGNTCTASDITAENGGSELSSNNFESSREMELLKVRNKEMEYELNEMQERYSEISLKLAEVEGGRQQLMMRVRNLKNSKKS